MYTERPDVINRTCGVFLRPPDESVSMSRKLCFICQCLDGSVDGLLFIVLSFRPTGKYPKAQQALMQICRIE